MAILTLTTDWGYRDPYLASFKGELLGLSPGAIMIDISHEVERFNILQASFVLKSAYHRFPPGTVHYIGLRGPGSPMHRDVAAEYLMVTSKRHFFVGFDSGIFSLVVGDDYQGIHRIPMETGQGMNAVFSGVIAALCALLNGQQPEQIGNVQEHFSQSFLPSPTVDADSLRGTVLYIDSFGNAIVNIDRELFDKSRQGRRFNIILRKSNYDINKIGRAYEDADVGEIVAFFNRENMMEIALNRDSAAGLLGIKIMDPIRIEFYDH